MTRRITLIGNVNLDLVMGPVDYWPRFGTETILPHAEWRVGGATGNTALALQSLDADFKIISNCGTDAFGSLLSEPFGVRSLHWTKTETETALSVGLTHGDNERTFFSTLGHLAGFSLDDVLAQLPTIAQSGEIALLSGVFVTPALRKDYNALIAILNERGFEIALDTGWPSEGWTDETRLEVLSWCAHCKHLLLNDIELRSLFGLRAEDAATMARAASEFLPEGGTVVMKRGKDGAVAFANGQLISHSAPSVSVVDTIGAGDVFNAGYLAALSDGKTLDGAIVSAIALASNAIATSPRQYCSTPLRGVA
jgi:sugar/nucleoside kinase (ribokinase family)